MEWEASLYVTGVFLNHTCQQNTYTLYPHLLTLPTGPLKSSETLFSLRPFEDVEKESHPIHAIPDSSHALPSALCGLGLVAEPLW